MRNHGVAKLASGFELRRDGGGNVQAVIGKSPRSKIRPSTVAKHGRIAKLATCVLF
jgi:hypothetical protein